MPFTKTQTIVLFTLLALVLVLGYVAFTFSPNRSQTPPETDSGTALITSVQESFADSVTQTDSRERLEALDNLSFAEKTELAGNLDSTVLVNGNFGYIPKAQNFSVYNGPLEEVAVFLPNSEDTYTDLVINRFGDGSKVYSRAADELGEADFAPLLRSNFNLAPLTYTYLVKDEVHVFLGENVVNVYQVEIDEEKYWVSFIVGQTGLATAYFSAPYFQGLTPLPGIIADGQNGFVNGRFLTLTTVSLEGGAAEITERVDLRGVALSPVQSDYSEFIETTITPLEAQE